jgi:uncharacterized protein YodC (DUF2158 family)
MALDVRVASIIFATGEQVELKSGGLPLTVLSFCAACGDVDVAYTDSEGDIEILTLPADALQQFVDFVPDGESVH